MSDDLGKSVRDRLSHTSEVTAIVGPRVYADVIPQGCPLPAVAVAVTASGCEEDLNSSNRLFHSQVTVTTFAVDRATANSVAKAIRDNALAADLRGTVEGMNFLDVSLSSQSELVDEPVAGGDNWRRITQQTFTIWAAPI